MSRLASFFTALWLSSVAATPGFLDAISGGVKEAKNIVTNEAQAAVAPVGESIAFVGGSLCPGVQKIAGVSYDSFEGKEPDMSELTLVYTTKAKTVYYKLAEAAVEIPKERWWNRKLVIYFHGFTDNPTKSSFQTMLAAFRTKEEDVSILALDASPLIAMFYLKAATMVRFIGTYLGIIIAALEPAGLELENVHLIGHSLGSHIAGFTGKSVLKQTGRPIGRIISLDPAGPCFTKLEESLRLSRDDASFVLAIHTDAGVYGLNEHIGHVDFYPNLGKEQPGCFFQTCSHSRAWELMAESVLNPEAFPAVKCDGEYEYRHQLCDFNDTSFMGYATPNTTRGQYYLITDNEEPYGAGVDGLTYRDNGVIRKVKLGALDFFGGAFNKINRS